nr:unnamed protein product [Callosobruchus analis]
MPKIKDSFFNSRLILFNETFASLAKDNNRICVLWHEAIAGRRTEDVACAFPKVLHNLR